MDWEDLRFFLALATRKSLAAAARDLDVSQATVWRHVGRLERTLECRAFNERAGRYELSSAGQKLFEAAQEIASRVEDAQKSLRSDVARLRGDVRVTAPEMLAEMISTSLNELGLRHPELRIELVVGNPMAMLSRRETDIALRFDATPQAEFSLQSSYSVGFGVYAAHDYCSRFGMPSGIEGFAGHRLIAFDSSSGHMAPARWSRIGGKDAAIVFRSNSLHARLSAARAGLGCVLLPCIVGDPGSGLFCVFHADRIGRLELGVFVNDRVRLNPRVIAVYNHLGTLLQSRKEDLAGICRNGSVVRKKTKSLKPAKTPTSC
jgi:DNA-binding transcriptional LysR family regulator